MSYNLRVAQDQDLIRETIRLLLERRGLTIRELAERAGIAEQTAYNFLGKTNPSKLGRKALWRIAEALAIPYETLIGADVEVVRISLPHGGVMGEASERVIRQIRDLLTDIDDEEERQRAVSLVLVVLREVRDQFERRIGDKPRGPAG